MKAIVFVFILSIFISCSPKLGVNDRGKSVVELINLTHKRKLGIKKRSAFQSYDQLVFRNREKAVQLFDIQTGIMKIDRFIIIDLVSFEGGKSSYGEILLNDTARYRYKKSFQNKEVENDSTPNLEVEAILEYVQTHRVKQLEAIANDKGKSLSGSNFFYIGMYEKNSDSIYVNMLPAFKLN